MHDEMNEAHVYEMKNAICGSQTPRVLHFASNLKWLVTKIIERIFLQLYFYAHFTRAKR
jgi:hypothetical protein